MKIPINTFSFSGKLVREEPVSGGKLLHIEQLVGGKMPTLLPVAVKTEFIPSHLKPGSEVFIGYARLSRSPKRELFVAGKAVYSVQLKADINEADISGIVTEITECGSSYILTLWHDDEQAAGIQVMVGSKAFEAHHITSGDEVLILGGLIYQKEKNFSIRVTDSSQIMLIERGNPDKGIIQARDKFI